MKIMDSMSFSTVREIQAHDNKIQCLSCNLHQTFLLSESEDPTSKMWDLETYTVKTCGSDRPLNACALSHQGTCVIGWRPGGMSVTTTAGRQGRFETWGFITSPTRRSSRASRATSGRSTRWPSSPARGEVPLLRRGWSAQASDCTTSTRTSSSWSTTRRRSTSAVIGTFPAHEDEVLRAASAP